MRKDIRSGGPRSGGLGEGEPDRAAVSGAPEPRSVKGALAGLGQPVAAAVQGIRGRASEPRYRRALEEVDLVHDPVSADSFVKAYLQRGSWPPASDHRADLMTCLVQRMRTSDFSVAAYEEAPLGFAKAMLNLVREIPGEQQSQPLAALAGMARDKPGLARALRWQMLAHAQKAHNRGEIDRGDYARILVILARSMTSGEPFDEQPIDGLQRTVSHQTDNPRPEQGRRAIERISKTLDAGDAAQLKALFDAMLKLAPGLSDVNQRDGVTALALITLHLSSAQQELREALECAQAARRQGSIDDDGYARILQILGRATAAADLQSAPEVLDEIIHEFEQVPPKFRGALYGSLFTSELASKQQPDVVQRQCFERAWWGITSLPREHAEVGIAMLKDTDWPQPDTREWIVERLLDDVQGPHHRDLLAPTLRAMPPIIASLPTIERVSSRERLLKRMLALIDGDTDVRAGDFLHTPKPWRTAECRLIVEHMYPIVAARADGSERQDLGELAKGLNPRA